MSKTTESAANPFFSLTRSPIKFKLYLFTKLPAAFFAGLKITRADNDQCVITIPYRWSTRNPFRSIYFACLGMAAEMSTGVLAMAHLYQRRPAVSMLVTAMEARFLKKATGLIRFTCTDGPAIRSTIEQAIATGEGQTVQVKSTGTNANGDPIAEFSITWSFKAKI